MAFLITLFKWFSTELSFFFVPHLFQDQEWIKPALGFQHLRLCSSRKSSFSHWETLAASVSWHTECSWNGLCPGLVEMLFKTTHLMENNIRISEHSVFLGSKRVTCLYRALKLRGQCVRQCALNLSEFDFAVRTVSPMSLQQLYAAGLGGKGFALQCCGVLLSLWLWDIEALLMLKPTRSALSTFLSAVQKRSPFLVRTLQAVLVFYDFVHSYCISVFFSLFFLLSCSQSQIYFIALFTADDVAALQNLGLRPVSKPKVTEARKTSLNLN